MHPALNIRCRHFDDDGVFFVRDIRVGRRGGRVLVARWRGGGAGLRRGRQSTGERGATLTRSRTMAEGLILIPIKGSS